MFTDRLAQVERYLILVQISLHMTNRPGKNQSHKILSLDRVSLFNLIPVKSTPKKSAWEKLDPEIITSSNVVCLKFARLMSQSIN